MPKDSYRNLCQEFINGNTSPTLAKQFEMKMDDFTLILKAFRKVGTYDDSTRSIMRKVSEKLIQDGISEEHFMKLTGYAKGTTKRIFKIIYANNSLTDKPENRKGLDEICRKFGLDPGKTIKSQWF